MPHWMQIELGVIWLVVFVFVGWLAMLSDNATTGIVDRESVIAGIVMFVCIGGLAAASIGFVQTEILFCTEIMFCGD